MNCIIVIIAVVAGYLLSLSSILFGFGLQTHKQKPRKANNGKTDAGSEGALQAEIYRQYKNLLNYDGTAANTSRRDSNED